MIWAQQLSLAFHLLNNAALLAVGTFGYHELRRRFHNSLPAWASSLIYGLAFGIFAVLTSFAPAMTVAGFSLSLRFAPIVIATLFCGVASGAVATLLLVGVTAVAGFTDHMHGWAWPILSFTGFGLAAVYKLLMPRHMGRPRLADLAIVAIIVVAATNAEVVGMQGMAAYAAAFAIAGPAWITLFVFTVVALGGIIRHLERTRLLATVVAANEQRFRGFYNETPVMMTAIDRNERVIAVSDRWLEVMGYRREDVLGRNRYDFVTPASAAFIRERVRPSLREGQPLSDLEIQLVRKDGTLVDIAATSVLRRDPITGADEVLNFAVDQTARKRAERALEERESDLRAIVDHAPVAIFLKDRDGRYRLVNQRFEEWVGIPASKIIGRMDAEITPADIAEQVRTSDLEVLEHGRVHQTERPPTVPQTREQQILVTKFPIRDGVNRVTGIAGFAVDVTERRRAEAALRESRELLVEAQRLGKIGYIYADRVTERAYWSDSVFEMRGVPKREYLSFAEAIAFIHPDDRPRYDAARDAAIAEHRDFELDARILRADGSHGWEHSIGRPRYDQAGNCVGLLVVLRDITENKRADEALKQKEIQLRAVMDNAPVAIYLKDRTGRYRLINHCYEEWFGYRPEDIIGRSSAEVYPPLIAERIARMDDIVLREGRIAIVDWPRISEKTAIGHLQVTQFPIRNEAGEIVGSAGFCVDVTEHKLADEALRKKEAELRAIMDNAPLAMFLKDRQGRYRLINRRYSTWMRLKPEQLYGRTSADVFPPEIAAGMEARDRAVIERGEVSVAEVPTQFIDPGIGIEHNLVTKFPVRDDAGEIVGIAGFAMDITAGKRAEIALRETQQRLQAIMDNAPFAIFLKGSDGRYQLINRTFTDWFGDRPEDLIGRTATEIYPAEQVERWEAIDREIVRSGGVAHEERPVLRAKPGIEYVLSTKFPIRDESGTSTGFAGIIADITTRKRTEIALDENRRLLLESQRLGKLAYIVSDAVKDRVIWSDTLFELRGVPKRDWFTFEEAREFIHPEDRPKYLRAREAALAARRDFEADVRARHGDGSYGWEHSIVHFQFDEAGACIGSLALVQDITERKLAEQALQQSEERFRALIEHSNDMVTVAARDGRITYRSPSSTEILGFPHEQIVGHSIYDRVHPDDLGALKAAFQSLRNNSAMRATARSRVRHQDGSWRTLAWSARDASDVPGIEGIIINSRDVTEAQLLEEQLRESQKMEAIGQLAGGIAHDFNNLLGAILGFSGFLLQDLPENSTEHGFAKRISRAGERGRDLVQQILTFSQRSSVERNPTDLADLVRETRDLLRASIPSSIGLQITIEEEGLIVDVNAAQVSQILLNLCLNAKDALEGALGSISVTLTRAHVANFRLAELQVSMTEAHPNAGSVVIGTLRPDRAYAQLVVGDTGAGIPSKLLRRVFEPFFTTKLRGRGTGLGLSVVHGIVMECEGAILAKSRPGTGSTFNVYLPLAVQAAAITAPQTAENVGGRERVLVVDDESFITDLLAIALDRLGYAVLSVNDPEQAIAAVAAGPEDWDVVISDQVMPGMKGLALLERLRAIRPQLRFILHTGFSDDATEESARAAGADAVVLKPAMPEDIAAAIRKLFDQPTAGAA